MATNYEGVIKFKIEDSSLAIVYQKVVGSSTEDGYRLIRGDFSSKQINDTIKFSYISESIGDGSVHLSPTCTYRWYLGETLLEETTSSCTISDLTPGRYVITAELVNPDNNSVIGTSSQEFIVLMNIPDPIHHIDFTPTTARSTTDLISSKVLSSPNNVDVNFCIGDIKGYKNMPFLNCLDLHGVIESSDLIEGEWDPIWDPGNPEQLRGLTQYTITFLTRIIRRVGGGGAAFRFSDDSHFYFLNNIWGNFGVNVPEENNIYYKWARITIVQERTLDQYPSRRTYQNRIYIDDVLAATNTQDYTYIGTDIPIGSFRIGGYLINDYYYPGEIADYKIYNFPFTTEQVEQLCAIDGENDDTGNLSVGQDFGGLHKVVELDAHYESSVTLLNNRYRIWFNGDTCWGAVLKQVQTPSALWASAVFNYPTDLYSSGQPMEQGGPSFPGHTIQTISIHDTYNRSAYMITLFLLLNYTTQEITLNSIGLNLTGGGVTYTSLDGRTIVKGVDHLVEIHYVSGASGAIQVYLDGDMIYNNSGNFTSLPVEIEYGMNLGTHIQPGPSGNGNIFYIDNVYVGTIRYSAYLTYLQNKEAAYNQRTNSNLIGAVSEINEGDDYSVEIVEA